MEFFSKKQKKILNLTGAISQEKKKWKTGNITLVRIVDMSWWRVRKPITRKECKNLLSHKSLFLGHPWGGLYCTIPALQWHTAGNELFLSYVFELHGSSQFYAQVVVLQNQWDLNDYLIFGIKVMEWLMNPIPFISFTTWMPISLKIRVWSLIPHAWCSAWHKTFLPTTDVWLTFLLCEC